MNSRTIIFVLFAFCFASSLAGGMPEPEPEPEFAAPLAAEGGECDLAPRSWKQCESESKRNEFCGACVTSKCKTCREVFNKFCMRPQRVTNIGACVNARCSKNVHWRFKDGKYRAKCVQAMKSLCARHACAQARPLPVERVVEPEPEPEPAAVVAGEECDLAPRSWKQCDQESKRNEFCGACVTSKCKTCREVFNKFCTRPQRVTNVGACINARCSKNVHWRFKDGKYRAKCVQAMKHLCARHACAQARVLPVVAEPEPEPKPEPEPVVVVPEPEPEPEPVVAEEICDLAPRSWKQCDEEAKADVFCGACVTSKCKTCREVFTKFCTRPQRVTNVDACVNARCSKNVHWRFKDGKYRAKCVQAMRHLCARQACRTAKPLPVEKPEPKPEPEAPVAPVAECKLRPRDQATCIREAELDENCTRCVTSKCKACRAVFLRFCMRPEPTPSVQACLNARCSKNVNKRFGDKRYKARCMSGLRKQCERHACGKGAVTPTGGAPVPVPVPRQQPQQVKVIERIIEKTIVKPQLIVVDKPKERTCKDRCPECDEIKSLLASVETITASVDISLKSLKASK